MRESSEWTEREKQSDAGRGKMQVTKEVVPRWNFWVSKGKECEAGLFDQE